MRRIAVHAVGAAGSDHADLGHGLAGIDQAAVALDVLHRMADLHRTGVRAQQVGGVFAAAFNIEGVVHGARRMVFGRVQRGEVEPVGFDLGAARHFKAHGTEDGLDALQRERDRMQTASTARAAGQGHVQRLGLQLRLQLGLGQGIAARRQRGLDRLLGQVDGGAAGFLFFDRQLGHALHQLGDLAGLAQETRLGVFQIIRGGGFGETLLRAGNNGVQVVHGGNQEKKGRWQASGICRRFNNKGRTAALSPHRQTGLPDQGGMRQHGNRGGRCTGGCHPDKSKEKGLALCRTSPCFLARNPVGRVEATVTGRVPRAIRRPAWL